MKEWLLFLAMLIFVALLFWGWSRAPYAQRGCSTMPDGVDWCVK